MEELLRHDVFELLNHAPFGEEGQLSWLAIGVLILPNVFGQGCAAETSKPLPYFKPISVISAIFAASTFADL